MSVDEIQFVFMPERRAIDAVFILRRTQKSIMPKEKLCILIIMVIFKCNFQEST